jgi:hypothetical protein
VPAFLAYVLAWTAAGRATTSAGIPGTGLSVRKYAKKGDPEAAQYQNAALIGILVALGVILVLVILAISQQ